MALLLWSGGCDSTLLLHDLLTRRYGNLDHNEVRTISVRHQQVPAADESRKARDAITAALAKKGMAFRRCEMSVAYEDTAAGWVDTNGGSPQPMLWMLQAALHLGPAEDLYVGYIRGDDVWHYRNKLFEAFDVLQWMNHRTGKLVLPLEWVTKREVVERLKHVGLYRHTWYCEDPAKGRKCGKCVPCKTHATALWQLSQEAK